MDETDKKLLAYLGAPRHAGAKELAALVGITMPSVRYQLFRLMALEVLRERNRSYVWSFFKEK